MYLTCLPFEMLTPLQQKIFNTMPANIITTDDLREFKIELLAEIKEMLSCGSKISPEQKKYLRSSEVTELLGISTSTLQHLRIQKILPYTKIGTIIFFEWQDVLNVLEKNKKVAKPKSSLSIFKN